MNTLFDAVLVTLAFCALFEGIIGAIHLICKIPRVRKAYDSFLARFPDDEE